MKARIYLFYGFLAIGFLLLLGRLFELQIIFGSQNRQIAEGNRIKKTLNRSPRGLIYDRQGRELVRNVPLFRLCPSVGGECRVISREEALRIEAHGGQEAENLRIDVGRTYLYGPALVHLLGYLGEANLEEVQKNQFQAGDLVGRTGVEEQFNHLLRGTDGGEVLEVNALGEKIREIGKIESIPGKDLYLSVDAQLSKVAFEALAGRAGAVVASEVKTGQILALVSSPSFNPEKITPEVLIDTKQPLYNRALAGLYPPGSTFKIVTAAAGLEEGKIDENTLYKDTGEIRVGEYVYKNWYFTQYGKTEGEIGIVKAIKRSTDTFFYQVGEWVGPEKLAAWARIFGLGKKTGIDLAGESEGLVPDPEWKLKKTGEKWFLGNTYHLAIGQADLLTTPLQVNLMTSVIASGGQLCQPSILKSESHCQDLSLNPKTIALIREGMKEVCSPGGTAFPLFNFSPSVACKTGTAEFAVPAGRQGDPQNRTHAWLTAFVLSDEALAKSGKEPIVVTAIVEGGGEGSAVAAPVVKKVLEAWFSH